MKIEYSFSKYITDRTSLRLHAMMPNRGEAESQQQQYYRTAKMRLSLLMEKLFM